MGGTRGSCEEAGGDALTGAGRCGVRLAERCSRWVGIKTCAQYVELAGSMG